MVTSDPKVQVKMKKVIKAVYGVIVMQMVLGTV